MIEPQVTKALQQFIKSKLLKLLLVLIVYFFLKEPIELLIHQFLCDPIFRKIPNSVVTDCILLFIGCLIWLDFALKSDRDYEPSANFYYFLVFVSVIYTYYRIMPGPWTFKEFTFKSGIYYFDLIYLYLVLWSLLFFAVKDTVNSKITENEFIYESPIGSVNHDNYGRKGFAEKIANKILASKGKRNSIAISINGEWGSGKTSFIKMIKHYLENNSEEKDRIIIEFHPWKSSGPKQIITDFFKIFTEEIKSYDGSLHSEINEYVGKLTKIEDNIFTKILNVINIFASDKSKESQYCVINNALEKIGKKFIIIIDDIDRLDKREIIEVIKLVRNTASFTNTTFIVSFDKEYVLNAIKTLNEHKFEYYLEKVFQFEFTLPAFEKATLKDELLNKLAPYLIEEHKQSITRVIYPINHIYKRPDIFDCQIKTNRDVIRYVNSFLFDYEFVKDEIEIQDFATLQLLKCKFHDIYSLLYDKRELLFELDNEDKSKKYRTYKLRELTDDIALQSKKKIKQPSGTQFYNFLLKHSSNKKYAVTKCEEILDIILSIFSTEINTYKVNERDYNKSMSICDNFYKYFSNRVFDGDLSIFEFNKTYNELALPDLEKKIDEWLAKGYEKDIAMRLSLIKTIEINCWEDCRKLIESIIYLGNKVELSDYNHHSIISNLYHFFNSETFQRFIDVGNESEKLIATKKYTKDLFGRAQFPFRFESNFLSTIVSHFRGYFILELEEIYEIQFNYLKKYLSYINELTDGFWHMILKNQHLESREIGNSRVEYKFITDPAVTNVVTTFIEEKNLLDKFLERILQWELRYQKLIGISMDAINVVFGNINTFEQYIEFQRNKKSSPGVEEFNNFMNEIKAANYHYIEFEFKILTPPIKRND